jgi:hypothetical protein
MDFWATDTIVEDGHQFWRSYLHFKGNYAVLPIYLPIYFDAFQGKNYFRSIKGQFLQLRRWAWGVTDLPFMAKKWWQKSRELPFWPTLVQFYRLFEGHFMWSAAPLLIGLTTPMVQFINWNYQHQVFTANANLVISTFFQIAIIGLFIAMGVSLLTLPAPAKWWQKLMIPLQWLLLPPITLFMGSFPALTAQVYLAIGKRLEFNVTPKIRKNLNPEVK